MRLQTVVGKFKLDHYRTNNARRTHRPPPSNLMFNQTSSRGLDGFGRRAVDLDLDLFRLRLGLLGQLQLQNAGVTAGLHVCGIDGSRKSKGTVESAITTLDPVEVLFLLFLLKLPLAANGQEVVFNANVKVFLLHSRHFEVQRDLVLVLIDVDRRSETGGRQRGAFTALVAGKILKKRVHAVLQYSNFTEWVPTNNSHCFSPIRLTQTSAHLALHPI